jgi:alpha-tubulin suppressor-like RCC1 family protein
VTRPLTLPFHARRMLPLLLASVVLGAVLGCGEDVTAPSTGDPEPALALGVTAATALSFRRVSGGGQHTCGVTTENRAYCWGANWNAQLGDGTTTNRTRPVPVSGGLQFIQVSAGQDHTCGLTTDNRIFCWGLNNFGQLGDGSLTSRSTPVAVAGNRRFRQLAAGYRHTCGVTMANVAFCWGNNTMGELGDGSRIRRPAPARVAAGGLLFLRVSAGGLGVHTCGVTTENRGYCWGDNTYGQLGNGTVAGSLRPVAVAGGLSFRQVVAASVHTCGVTTGDKAYCWGRNEFGRLGDGFDVQRRVRPNAVAGTLRFSGVDSDHAHTCGVTTTKIAYCWGGNWFGHLGDGTTTTRYTPTAVIGGLNFTAVSTGAGSTCGITGGGRLYCWGWNASGQVGDGTTTNRTSPVPVADAM